jgi:chitinase
VYDSSFFDALISLALVLAPSTTPSGVDGNGSPDLKVTGYYGPHSPRFRGLHGPAKPENIDYTKLTRINYSSFQINGDGNIWGTDVNADPELLFGPVDWNPPENAPMFCHQSSPDVEPMCRHHKYEQGLIDGAHGNGAEVYAVIGGEEFSEQFSQVASDLDLRKKFSKNAASLLMNYNFDGLDIAWQFPESSEAMTNYTSLLSEVRLALNQEERVNGRSFGLTATLPCDHENMVNIDIGLLDSVLSEFNLLSVDFYGPWDGRVGVNSPLYDPKVGHGDSINSCVVRYMEAGAPSSKINIGLAFYGHSFRGAKHLEDTCKLNWAGICSDTTTWQLDGGSPLYYNIYKKMPELAISFDAQTMTPLAYNDNGIVSFDDPRSICFKTDYAIINEIGGVVIMDLTGDMLDDKSTPLLDAINFKLLKPGIDCGGEEFQRLFQWRDVGKYNPWSNTVVAPTERPKPVEVVEPTGPISAYRYTCGFGQGDAKESCNNPELERISCDTGVCPTNMICFVVLCTEQREDKVEDEPQENEVKGQSSAASFSKRKPKPKPKRKPRPIVTENDAATTKRRPSPEEVRPREEMGLGPEANTAPKMSFSCGTHFEHAKSCGIPCPDGLADCPSGHFCFWLECDGTTETRSSVSASTITTSVTTEAPRGPPVMKYQCGETRKEALSCPQDCGFAWECPEGKDCYNVPCYV